jgi:hypothetical protein
MMSLITGLAIAFLIGWAYNSGKKDGTQGGWSAAWRQARGRFHVRRRYS